MRPGTSWCPEVGLGIPNLTSGHLWSRLFTGRVPRHRIDSRATARRRRKELLRCPRCMGGLTKGRGELTKEKRVPEKEFAEWQLCEPGLTVLIIYNTGTSEIFDFWNPLLCLSEKHHFAHSQKTYENPMDFKRFCFRPNSPRELSFYFCHTYNAFWMLYDIFVVRLRSF